MTLWQITLQNIKSKPIHSVLSIVMLSISIALFLGISQLEQAFKHQLNNNLGGIDMVIGAKGSPLQLVLSSVLHIDNPTGNIPYSEAKKIEANPMIDKAIPVSYGDNFKGYRIVGTTAEFLNIYDAEFYKGRAVKAAMEVVIGSQIAQQLELKIGATFKSAHGLVANDFDIHDDTFEVVGILKPTHKLIDRLIICNLESVWEVHDHDNHENHDDHNENHHLERYENQQGTQHDDEHKTLHGANKNIHNKHQAPHQEGHLGSHDHEEQRDSLNQKEGHSSHDHGKQINEINKEITSLLVTFRNPAALLNLPRKINKNTNMLAALPKYELNKLFEFTGIGLKTISLIAYIILVFSGVTIFLSLYKMIKDRAFDLALMRTYGASNFQLIKMVCYEGLTILILSFLVGLLFTKIGLYYFIHVLPTKNQYFMNVTMTFDEVVRILGYVLVVFISAVALTIYPILKMNISTILSNER